jgi:hypothetical protein
MLKRVRQSKTKPTATHFMEAIAHQREMLTDLLTVPMFKTARRLGPLIYLHGALDL